MTQKDSYAQVLESLAAEAAVQRLSVLERPKDVALASGDSAPQKVDLVLLAHDHVLEQVLERL